MNVGLLQTILSETSEVEVNVYGVIKDLRMTPKLRPLFYDAEGQPVFEMEKPTYGPVLQKVSYSQILRPITLTQHGVMQASDMRALDTQGWSPQVQGALGYSILGKLETRRSR